MTMLCLVRLCVVMLCVVMQRGRHSGAMVFHHGNVALEGTLRQAKHGSSHCAPHGEQDGKQH
jgi:hypothetical protein